jgi:hypothetical protein
VEATNGRSAFLSWENEVGDPGSSGGSYEPDQIETVWVLDIDGTVVVINTRPYPEASAAAHAEFAAVLDSIRIDRASPTVPPTTPPRALPNTDEQLVPGTYFIDEVDGLSTPRIFATVGEGWGADNNVPVIYPRGGPGSMKEGGGWMMFSRPSAVFSDACHATGPTPYHLGSVTTLDGLVAALIEQQGWVDVTAPSDISIDGYAGKAFQRTAPADMSDCDTMGPGYGPRVRTGTAPYAAFLSWENDRGDRMSGGGPYEPGQIETLWIIDIDGTVVLINTRPFPEASAATNAEFAAVLDSIRIERA